MTEGFTGSTNKPAVRPQCSLLPNAEQDLQLTNVRIQLELLKNTLLKSGCNNLLRSRFKNKLKFKVKHCNHWMIYLVSLCHSQIFMAGSTPNSLGACVTDPTRPGSENRWPPGQSGAIWKHRYRTLQRFWFRSGEGVGQFCLHHSRTGHVIQALFCTRKNPKHQDRITDKAVILECVSSFRLSGLSHVLSVNSLFRHMQTSNLQSSTYCSCCSVAVIYSFV